MSPLGKRRILRRVAWTLAAIVLLLAAYVASVASASFLYGAGWLPAPAVAIAEIAYRPLGWYVEAGYPGTDAILAMVEWSTDAGERIAK